MRRKIILLVAIVSLCSSLMAASATRSPANLNGEDMKGNAVTADVFKDYDVTMVNIFTTWCGYCINEMPDLNKLYSQLPENANLIGICADAYEKPDDLEAIVDYFELKFPVLKMTDDQVDKIYNVLGYPTTIFVDKNGKLLDVITGAPKNPLKDYGSKINSLLGKTK
ncbi:MAG: TlpA family protein disulfide reductase [Spirochaetales bacterium]|nr:TlpA family protein disulfide reductase [Spirochaetales bacterium]